MVDVDTEPHGEPPLPSDDEGDVVEDIDQEVPVRCDKCDRIFIRVNQWQVKAVNGIILCGDCRGADKRRQAQPKTTRSSSESSGSVDHNPVIRTTKPETLAQKKKAKVKAKPSGAPTYEDTQTVSWQTKEDLDKRIHEFAGKQTTAQTKAVSRDVLPTYQTYDVEK